MMHKVVMWRAVVYTEAQTAGAPEILPGLHPTSREAMAEAQAVMNGRADASSAAARRVVLGADDHAEATKRSQAPRPDA